MGKNSFTLDVENLPDDLKTFYSFIVDDILTEYVKYYSLGNKAAGLRLRKNTLTLKKFAEAMRKQVREDLSED